MAVPVLRPRQLAAHLGSGTEIEFRRDRGRSGLSTEKTAMIWKERRYRAGGAAGHRGAGGPALAQNEQFIPSLVYRTGAYAPNGIPFANGLADYYKLVNERDGGINGVKIVFEECDTGYATDRGVECYERSEGQGLDRRRLFPPALDGHHLCAHRESADRQDRDHHYGLRPVGIARRLGIPVEFPAARHVLDGRRHHPAAHRQARRAGSTSSRARRSRWSITTCPSAKSRSRCCRSVRSCMASNCCSCP